MKHLKDIQFGDFEVSILEETNPRGYALDIRDEEGENLAGFYFEPNELNFETENLEKVLSYVLENEKKHFEEDETPDETLTPLPSGLGLAPPFRLCVRFLVRFACECVRFACVRFAFPDAFPIFVI